MRQKLLMFGLACSLALALVPVNLYAVDAQTVKYDQCISKYRQKKVESLQAKCAPLEEPRAIALCKSSADNSQLDSSIIETCKIDAGLVCDSSKEMINGVCMNSTGTPDKSSTVPRFSGPPAITSGGSTVAPPADTAVPLPPTKPADLRAVEAAVPLPPVRPRPVAGGGGASDPIPDLAPKASPTPTGSGGGSGGGSGFSDNPSGSGAANKTAGSIGGPNNTSGGGSSAQYSPTDDSAAAQAQASADLSACMAAQSKASAASNPTASAQDVQDLQALQQSGDSGGLQAYCQEMASAGNSNSSINGSLGATCTTSQVSCSSTCASLAQKYSSLIDACTDCESYSIYTSTYQSLSSAQSSCDGLASRCDTLTRQGLQAGSSAYGDYCNQNSAAMPTNMSGANAMGAANGAFGGAGGANGDCPPNATRAECQARAQQAEAASAATQSRGETSFQSASASGAQKFALPAVDTSLADASPVGGQGPPGAAPEVKPIPNNSGGGVGGAGGSSSASLGSASPSSVARAGGGSGFASTDIDHGLSSGGYSAPAGTAQPSLIERGLASLRRSRGSESDGSGFFTGLDLKQYLPGGSRDPSRRLAGAGFRSEINAKEEDIWRRISNKMIEKCRLGVLWQCR